MAHEKDEPTKEAVNDSPVDAEEDTPQVAENDPDIVVGEWHGQTNYKCRHCEYSTLEGPEAVGFHIIDSAAHPNDGGRHSQKEE